MLQHLTRGCSITRRPPPRGRRRTMSWESGAWGWNPAVGREGLCSAGSLGWRQAIWQWKAWLWSQSKNVGGAGIGVLAPHHHPCFPALLWNPSQPSQLTGVTPCLSHLGCPEVSTHINFRLSNPRLCYRHLLLREYSIVVKVLD